MGSEAVLQEGYAGVSKGHKVRNPLVAEVLEMYVAAFCFGGQMGTTDSRHSGATF